MANGVDHVGEFTLQEQYPRAGMVQDAEYFLGTKTNIESEENRTGLRNSIVAFQQSMAIWSQIGHNVLRLDSEMLQGIGQLLRPGMKCAVCPSRVSTNDSHLVG